jgi:hypothetical protein
MRQFRDKTDQSWQIDLTIGAVMRVRDAEPDLDLLDAAKQVDGKPLQVVLWIDLRRFWHLLWLLIEPQAEARQVSAQQFGELVSADCLVEAQLLFFSEWRDFFQSLRRPDAAMAVETQLKTQIAAVKMVEARIEAVDKTEMLKRIESRLEKDISSHFGKVQESLDAIRGDSPGGNSTG